MTRKLTRGVAPAALALALALAGCKAALDTGTSDPAGASSSTAAITKPAACDADKPYLAVALPNLTNPYYLAMKKGFEDEGKAQKFTVEVQIANDDDSAQLAQVQAMLQKKPCALALNAVKSEPAAAIVKAANDAGVPVFTVNVIVSPEALTDQGARIVQYLGADNTAGGAQVAEQVLKDAGPDAKLSIGFVTEPDEVPTQLRDKGFEQAIGKDANAKVVAKVDGNVKPDDSLKAATELISGHPDLNVIYANTGPAAYGTLQAVQNKNIKVYGFCASQEPLTKQYAGCAAQEPGDYGRRVVQQVRGWLDGGTPEKEILRPLKLFTTGSTPAPGEVG
jgi:ribose transport system substrate-binding protein